MKMNNILKEDAIKELISKIYDYNDKLIISKNDIKKVEEYYKNNQEKYSDIQSFTNSNENIKEITDKLKAGKDEINKQLKNKKALQPGILAECVFMQTLAKILKLRNYIDLEGTPFSKVPIELAPYVKDSSNTICSARYIYYNKNDYETLVIQYGNPKGSDAAAIIYKNEIIIEIKDMPALLLDKDIIYDENGKIIIPEEIKSENPEYAKFIEKFNIKTNIFDNLGSNYKFIDDRSDKEEIKNLLNKFFDTTNIDLIITATKADELVAIKPSDICFIFEDGDPLVKTDNSEIRTTGKNFRTSPFTPKYLEKILKEKEVEVNDTTGKCRIYDKNDKILGGKHGRGLSKDKVTRFKINNAFFVKTKDITNGEGFKEFHKSKIKQSKLGISIHVEISKVKNEIREALYPKEENNDDN